MEFEEYTARLADLRAEYSSSIKDAAVRSDGVTLIEWAETEAAEYRLRVAALITEYRSPGGGNDE